MTNVQKILIDSSNLSKQNKNKEKSNTKKHRKR